MNQVTGNGKAVRTELSGHLSVRMGIVRGRKSQPNLFQGR